MKILRIQLHPFGGVADRAFEFHDGLNAIEGPNEFGKSTLNNALWHILFTQSNLTPAKLRDTMGRWFPKPSGDHARVTLEFEAQGQKWTLQKSWGAGAFSTLKSGESAAIADPTRVQERLSQLLHRNEATWRHVLFVNQAQLNRTIHELKENSAQVDDLQPLLAGAAAIPGDIAPEKLATAIDSRIKAHFSRWDRTANGPERGRGIDNPFEKSVGPLLAAYYAMETTRRELDQVLAHEKEVDRINDGIRQMEESINADRDFVTTGRGLREGLAKREGLEEKVRRLTGEQAELRKVLVDWPGADQVIETTRQSIQQVNETIEALDAELANARKRVSAEALKTAHDLLVKARDAWQSADAKLQESKPVPPVTFQELKSLAKKTEELRIQIAAQKLSARLESKSSVSVTLTRGVETPESLDLTPGAPWEGQAEGKLKLELQDLSIEVASGTGDVQSLFSQLEQRESRQKEILAGLKLEDLASVEVADARHRDCVNEEKNAKQLYNAALQGKSEDVWTAEITALDALPPTRSVAVLDDERNKAVTRKAELEAGIRQVQENVEKWRRDFANLDMLTSLILSKAGELKDAETQLAALPLLPEGFENVAAYFTELGDKEQRQEGAKEALNRLKQEQSAISATTPKRTAEELREELESREREFHRRQETGQALLRIQSKLEEIVEERGNEDPMKNVETAIAGHFHDLTCGAYGNVRLDGGTPVEVTGKLTLGTESLSQGTLGSLALATRLALAELYLKDLQGFLVLDDPFTDMDPSRRRAAAQCLGTFAGKRQVIFFTCHPEHAGELKELAGAKTPWNNGNGS
jgi:hypothetical protein